MSPHIISSDPKHPLHIANNGKTFSLMTYVFTSVYAAYFSYHAYLSYTHAPTPANLYLFQRIITAKAMGVVRDSAKALADTTKSGRLWRERSPMILILAIRARLSADQRFSTALAATGTEEIVFDCGGLGHFGGKKNFWGLALQAVRDSGFTPIPEVPRWIRVDGDPLQIFTPRDTVFDGIRFDSIAHAFIVYLLLFVVDQKEGMTETDIAFNEGLLQSILVNPTNRALLTRTSQAVKWPGGHYRSVSRDISEDVFTAIVEAAVEQDEGFRNALLVSTGPIFLDCAGAGLFGVIPGRREGHNVYGRVLGNIRNTLFSQNLIQP